ncbi:hypothetical protein E3C22_19175 [Jiella endophytica]|uniref:Antitoxin FitA-like ribbon-helix-helix domain-containing protein n=1 Tax=Jiella endophytica TaxID=2558362 RepID=A0A4Y8RDJ5_9HYPH|nr:hypothetical protein [Jiella endophytica]TFF19802.1 hypothetical protein E3C22_19175 [Jiella endophytica]
MSQALPEDTVASLTIDHLDDAVMRRLEGLAKAHGRSVVDEARELISTVAAEPEAAQVRREWDEDKERRLQRILSLGEKPKEPFDQKAYTDELWNFVE